VFGLGFTVRLELGSGTVWQVSAMVILFYFLGGSGKCSVEGHFPYICGLLWPAVFAGIPARRGLLGID